MGARTIDEGSMDEQGGMNFSEYVAILSGNTDLLDKAKLENRLPPSKASANPSTVANPPPKPNWKTSCRPSPRTAT